MIEQWISNELDYQFPEPPTLINRNVQGRTQTTKILAAYDLVTLSAPFQLASSEDLNLGDEKELTRRTRTQPLLQAQ